MSANVDSNFWKGKKVFLTGHTGFKGSWLSLWLLNLGAEVKGFSLEPPTSPSLYKESKVYTDMISEIGDIRNVELITQSMTAFNPDILFHMAAQPLVRLSYKEPLLTYSTNVMGSLHVLEAARNCSNLKAIVNVTTDKCYENQEWAWGYRENEPMGGHDPYSNSKGCVELLTSSYQKSFFNESGGCSLATARAGNVIGGGDWADDRLIPDVIRAFERTEPALARNPNSIRPWQHVLEPLSGYLVLAEKLFNEGQGFAEGWNFGPKDEDARSVEWILNTMVEAWGENVSWLQDSTTQPHEAQYLKLDISKARQRLDWSPTWSLEKTLSSIVSWHKARLLGKNIRELCLDEINQFMIS